MKTAALLLVAVTLLAKEAPKLSDALLKERWKALAVHQINAVQYLEIQAKLAQSKAAYEKAVADLRSACGKDFILDESGPEVTCVAIPAKKEK